MVCSILLLSMALFAEDERISIHQGTDEYLQKVCNAAVPQSTKAMFVYKQKGESKTVLMDIGLQVFYLNIGGEPTDNDSRKQINSIVSDNLEFLYKFNKFDNVTHRVISIMTCIIKNKGHSVFVPEPAFPVFENNILECQELGNDRKQHAFCIADVVRKYKIKI